MHDVRSNAQSQRIVSYRIVSYRIDSLFLNKPFNTINLTVIVAIKFYWIFTGALFRKISQKFFLLFFCFGLQT